jgi:release factor glutamine methyltransferase
MTWRDAVREASFRMRDAGIDDHALNAKYLAAHVLGVWSLSDLRPMMEDAASDAQIQAYTVLVDRRIANEPLQYIVGETEFYGLRLKCTPAALIPRPETEILVESAIEEARSLLDKRDHLDVLDIGTGTGAIALAFSYSIPAAHVVAIDASVEAIALAEENKARLADARTRFTQMDAMSDEIRSLGKFDLILSNPPYVSTIEYDLLPADVRGHEPRMALTDEAEGLIFYKRIAELAKTMLRSDGCVIVELSYDGVIPVSRIFEEQGFTHISAIKDLSGIDRILVAKL